MSLPEHSEPEAASGRGARLAHDLRGPLLTIEGFAAEIAIALEELERMLDGSVPADTVVARLGALLDEDLRPCLDFLGRAATMLHERIDSIEPNGPASDGS